MMGRQSLLSQQAEAGLTGAFKGSEAGTWLHHLTVKPGAKFSLSIRLNPLKMKIRTPASEGGAV